MTVDQHYKSPGISDHIKRTMGLAVYLYISRMVLTVSTDSMSCEPAKVTVGLLVSREWPHKVNCCLTPRVSSTLPRLQLQQYFLQASKYEILKWTKYIAEPTDTERYLTKYLFTLEPCRSDQSFSFLSSLDQPYVCNLLHQVSNRSAIWFIQSIATAWCQTETYSYSDAP